jgi:hypothetical protein
MGGHIVQHKIHFPNGGDAMINSNRLSGVSLQSEMIDRKILKVISLCPVGVGGAAKTAYSPSINVGNDVQGDSEFKRITKILEI